MNNGLRNKILNLRKSGKTYREIEKINAEVAQRQSIGLEGLAKKVNAWGKQNSKPESMNHMMI